MELKELKDLLKVLRAQGVLEFKSKDLLLKLSEDFPQHKEKKQEQTPILEEQELTEEELIFYSAIPPAAQIEAQ